MNEETCMEAPRVGTSKSLPNYNYKAVIQETHGRIERIYGKVLELTERLKPFLVNVPMDDESKDCADKAEMSSLRIDVQSIYDHLSIIDKQVNYLNNQLDV